MTAQHPPEWPADNKPYVRAYVYNKVYLDEDEVQLDEQFLQQRGWQHPADSQVWVRPFDPFVMLTQELIAMRIEADGQGKTSSCAFAGETRGRDGG